MVLSLQDGPDDVSLLDPLEFNIIQESIRSNQVQYSGTSNETPYIVIDQNVVLDGTLQGGRRNYCHSVMAWGQSFSSIKKDCPLSSASKFLC